MLSALNIFFHVSHIIVIGFTLIGWAFRRTRLLHLLLILLTLFSWIVLGFFFGWGYCFWTDWHWQVREKLGKSHPSSYVKLLVDSITGASWDSGLIDIVTAAGLAVVVLLTIVLNIRDWFTTEDSRIPE